MEKLLLYFHTVSYSIILYHVYAYLKDSDKSLSDEPAKPRFAPLQR